MTLVRNVLATVWVQKAKKERSIVQWQGVGFYRSCDGIFFMGFSGIVLGLVGFGGVLQNRGRMRYK